MEIRELTKDDVASLIELYVQLDEKSKTLTCETSRAVWENSIENNRNIIYYGAVENGQVVSTCYCAIIPNLTNNGKSICFVENVVMHKDFRKRGLAKQVIQKAIDTARERNCYKVILMSNCARTEAHQFYEHLGFRSDTKKAFDLRLS
ncbi:MAG: GNAT family N-acetyltransferase [Treponema sp.]|nr:GNAT family N-acetyltransferase [Treponema sp.]